MSVPVDELKNRLKEAMDFMNMRAVDLSQKTGIPKGSISQYLSGYVKPNSERVYLISRVLKINEAWLMGYDVPKEAKYYSKNYELSAEEEAIITIFRSMNKLGQDRLLDYSTELIEISKYKLKNRKDK